MAFVRVSSSSLRLGLVTLAWASALSLSSVVPALAEDVASSSGSSTASGTASATTNDPSHSTVANESQNAASSANASSTPAGDKSATAQTQSGTVANAQAGGVTLGMTISGNASASAVVVGETKLATSEANAQGVVLPAALNAAVHATASSGPGQLTASASGSDGSFAFAALGNVNDLKTFVPGGVTKQQTKGALTFQISCNSGGTCSQASVGGNSVSAGIRLVATTGLVNAGSAEAILNAVLNAEAGASVYAISASASSQISGNATATMSTGGHHYEVQISGSTGNWVGARIGPAVSARGAGASASASSVVWRTDRGLCASTTISYHRGRQLRHGTFTKCTSSGHIQPSAGLAHRPGFFEKLFASNRVAVNSRK